MTDQRISKLRAKEVPRKNSVGHADSIEKIVLQLSLLSPDPVTYQAEGKTGRMLSARMFNAPVNEVVITPSLFRHFVCAANCTACCQKFTLDYTPHEFATMVQHKQGFEEREVIVNGKKKVMWTNDQNANSLCDFLTVEKPTGGLGCAQWPAPPLSCISAPQLQFIQMRYGITYVLKKPYGRAWAMTPTPKCEFNKVESFEEMHLEDILAILDRFYEWARYLGIRTCISKIQSKIRWCEKTGVVPVTTLPVWQR